MKKIKNRIYQYRIDWYDRSTNRECLNGDIIYLINDIKYITNEALVRILKSTVPEANNVFITNVLFLGFRARGKLYANKHTNKR